MKKITLFAIAALGVFALASCKKEAVAPEADGKAIQVTVVPEVEKAFLDDVAGFQFAANDNLYWVSESGNASQTIEAQTKVPTVTMTIPGLTDGDVTGYFASFSGSIDFTAQEIAPGCGDIFVAGKQITIPAATEEIEVAVGIVGSAFRFFPYSADFTAETIKSVSVVSETAFAGTATYNAAEGTLSCIPTATAVSATVPAAEQINVEAAKGAGYIVKVPEGTIAKPVFKVLTDAAEYTFTCTEDKVCKAGYVYDIPLNLAKATRVEPYEIAIALSDITTNDPMQYVVGGSDTYGFNSNKDWFGPINESQASARRTKYGLVENVFDKDIATCYHTNLDWGEPGTSWGQRSDRINSDRYAKRYFQIDLPAVYNGVDLAFTLSDSGAKPEGISVQASKDFSGYTEVAKITSGIDFSAAFAATANGKVSSIRIVNTKEDSDWTFIASAFGVAELSVTTFDADPSPILASSVTLDKTVLNIAEGTGATLKATVHPDKASDKSVLWYSDDEGVATVADGVVTAVSEGETVITVETVDGGFTATCAVTVVAVPPMNIITVRTNDPMQYVAEGQNTADEYGLKGSPDWFNALTPAHKANREAKYGLAANINDGDPATCFHTNLDWGQIGTSWGQRSSDIFADRDTKRYIDVVLEDTTDKAKLWFQNSDSGNNAEGYQIYTNTTGAPVGFTKFGDPVAAGDFGDKITVDNINVAGIKAIRIENTKKDADWTYIASAFGIAEIKVFDQSE